MNIFGLFRQEPKITNAITVNRDGDIPEIRLYGPIGEDFWGDGITAEGVARALDDIGPAERIRVSINSMGGVVWEGAAIYNLLLRHAAQIDVFVDGLAASAASTIAMAGNTITMAKNGLMMIHNPGTIVLGNAADMRKTADALDTVKGSIVAAYVDKTGKAADEISALMDDETWMTASEAVDLRFADAVDTKSARVTNKADLAIFNHVIGSVPKEYEERLKALGYNVESAASDAVDIDGAVPTSVPETKGESTMDYSTLTLADVEKHRPDLYNEIKTKATEEGYAAGVKAENERCMTVLNRARKCQIENGKAKAWMADTKLDRAAVLDAILADSEVTVSTRQETLEAHDAAFENAVASDAEAGVSNVNGQTATQKFQELVTAEKAKGVKPEKAVTNVIKANPDLHALMRDENRGKSK